MSGFMECAACGGDGWYVGHDDECYETGDCNCSGVQIACEHCNGTGQVRVLSLDEVEDGGLDRTADRGAR